MNLAYRCCKISTMKIFRFIAFSSLLMLFAISCASFKNTSNSMEHINRKWMLIEYKDFTKSELMELGANMDLTKNKENLNRFSAKMGCNGMFFTAEFNKGKSKFSTVVSTRMYCEGRMKLEELFGKELPEMTQYKIEGHFLTLSDSNGNKMKFIAADWD